VNQSQMKIYKFARKQLRIVNMETIILNESVQQLNMETIISNESVQQLKRREKLRAKRR
jgi:hypothetical protein